MNSDSNFLATNFLSFMALKVFFSAYSLSGWKPFWKLVHVGLCAKKIDGHRTVDILKGIVRLFSIALELRRKGGRLDSLTDIDCLKNN